jgi:hypothetical protein
MRAKDWAELEKMAGIRRTEPPRATGRDVNELTRRRLAKSPFWRRRRNRTN